MCAVNATVPIVSLNIDTTEYSSEFDWSLMLCSNQIKTKKYSIVYYIIYIYTFFI